jgi:predicted lipoprotein with Yx(FWY)xxD motif
MGERDDRSRHITDAGFAMNRYSIALLLLLANVSIASAAQSTYAYPASNAAATAPAPKPATSNFPPIRQRAGILVDLKGRGLYNFGGDDIGKSNCSGQCILLWPPILADAGAQPKGDFTLVVRDDGQKQWAWKGRPLYRWVSDKKRGDAGGDGVNGMWHLARLQPAVPELTPEAVKPAH